MKRFKYVLVAVFGLLSFLILFFCLNSYNKCKRTHGLISIYRWFDFFGKLTR